jgi:hypothetical protein
MNNEPSACLFTNKQTQLKTVINLVKYHMKAPDPPTLYWSTGIYVNCLCGCEKIVYCGLDVDAVSGRSFIRLYGTKQYVKLGDWVLVTQNKSINPLAYCFVNQIKFDNFIYGKEVIMLNEIKDSPLCSVLTAEGMLDEVINLDWPGFDASEEATTQK